MEKQYRETLQHFAMPFNSEGMYRGWIGPDGVPHVQIYKD